MTAASVLVVGMKPEASAALATALRGEATLRVVPRVPADGTEVTQGRPPVAVVSLEADAPAGLRLVARLTAAGTRVVALGASKDADLILKAMRAGAQEFAVATDVAEITKAIRLLLKPATHLELGSVVTVFGCKGGVGATTLAVNTAGLLQRGGKRVCLLDLDVNLGDVIAFLDVSGSYSISDVVANLHRLDRELLDTSLPKHRSGLHVLAQSGKLEEADRVDGGTITQLLEFLRHQYDWIVVDGVRSFDARQLAALDVSEHVLLVVTQEIPSVRNAHRCADIFKRLGYVDGRVKLVVNRHQPRGRVPDDAIVDTIGIPIAARVGNDFPATSEAIHRGSLVSEVAPRSAVLKDVEALVRLIGLEAEGDAAPRSLLKRLFAPRAVPHGA